MRIKVAQTAGFCFGVDRAVKLTYSLLDGNKSVCTLGPIIHNPQVIADLESRGVKVISSPEEAKSGEVVVIRAHGVSETVEKQLEASGAEVCDATCPFVEKIHKLVSENSSVDVPVLIAGDASHPEVVGIMGHCRGKAFTFSNETELEKLLQNNPELEVNPVTVVSQTTFSQKTWDLCKKYLKLHFTNATIFDTICLATQKRQQEAAALSKECDVMIIIGGRQSSNTAKLQAVCSENCTTYLVERAEELKNIDLFHAPRIGVTAGASTPAEIIKEVLLAMSDNLYNNDPMVEEVPSAAADDANWFNEELSDESIVKCVVEAIAGTEVKVSLPGTHRFGGLTGILSFDEYSNDPNADPTKELKIGDEISLVIMKGNDSEGTVMLSKKRADAQKAWIDVMAAAEDENAVLEGTVCEVVKGGVLVNCAGARVFIPASQATVRRSQPLEDLLGQKVKFAILELRDAGPRKKAVGSIRKLKDMARDAFWEKAEVGQVYQGTVKTLTSFGAFVEIADGVEGLAHISELSWKRIKDPSEVLEVGQSIEVYIKALDSEKKKISLGYKKEEDNPWKILEANYPVGTVIDSTIVTLTTFGAFGTVIPNIQGLIHISQIANQRIDKPSDVLTVGDVVKVKITDIDFEKQRVSLSIRALLEPETEEAAEEVAEEAVEEAPAEAPVEAAEEPAAEDAE